MSKCSSQIVCAVRLILFARFTIMYDERFLPRHDKPPQLTDSESEVQEFEPDWLGHTLSVMTDSKHTTRLM